MNRWSKRPAAALLAAVLILGLTACGRKEKEIHRVNWITAHAYLSEDIALPVQTGDLTGCCTDGETMYILTDEKLGGEVRSTLNRVDLKDGTARELDGFQATVVPDGGSKITMGPVLAPDGTLWLYEIWSIIYYDLPDDFDRTRESMAKYIDHQDEFHHLRQLDPNTGQQKKLADLSDAVRTLKQENALDVSSFAVDGEGNIYFARNGGVAVLDGRGNLLFTLEAGMPSVALGGSAGGRLALLPDGTVAALTTLPGGKRAVRTIDPAARSWGETSYELSSSVDQICSGAGGFLFFFVRGRSLYAWEPEGAEERLLLNWSDTGVEGSVMCFAPMDEGRLSVLTLQYNGTLTSAEDWYKGQLRLSRLNPTDKGPNKGRVTLIYGTFGEDSRLRNRIDIFNKTHPDCYIKLRNYAGDGVELFYDVDREAARDGAMKLLNAEVMSGNIPDLWDASLPVDLYARKGCLEDLWPWIEGDEQIGGRDALMSHVLDCMSIDGQLYKLSDVFNIKTAIARSDIVGDRTGWTLEELLKCYETMPKGSTIMGASVPIGGAAVLLGEWIFRPNASRWIDWSTGTCSFDSEDFKNVLELCARIGEGCEKELTADGNPSAAFLEGRQLLEFQYLNKRSDLLYWEAMCAGPEHMVDYADYLHENHIFGQSIDEYGNPRGEDAMVLHNPLAAVEQAKKTGTLYGQYALTADAVFGAVEGGGYASFVGFPSLEGSGSTFFLPRHVSMSASCENKEAAWNYIRQFLLEASYDQDSGTGAYGWSGFPINRTAFDKYMAPKWLENGNGDYLLDTDGNRIEKPGDLVEAVPAFTGEDPKPMVVFDLAPNKEQMEAFWKLYNAIGPSQEAGDDLVNIIIAQSQPYFAGDKSLEETANLIQRRVTLYVNENR